MTRKVDVLAPLGALYYNTGRYEEALLVYREAAALQPGSTDIGLALVSTRTAAGRDTRTASNTLCCLPQAQVLAMAGRPAEAEEMTSDIISREGGCIECYRLLSAICSKRGNFTQVGPALGSSPRVCQCSLCVSARLWMLWTGPCSRTPGI